LVVTLQPDDWQDEQPERDASYLFPDAVYDVVKPPLHLIGVRFKYPGVTGRAMTSEWPRLYIDPCAGDTTCNPRRIDLILLNKGRGISS